MWTPPSCFNLCLTLCDPMDYTVHGILWARIVEWIAFPFSRRSSQPRDWTQVSSIAGGFFPNWAFKNPPTNAGDIRDTSSTPGSGRSPGGGHGQPTPIFLPRESHVLRSLAGYSPQGHKSQSRLKQQSMHAYTRNRGPLGLFLSLLQMFLPLKRFCASAWRCSSLQNMFDLHPGQLETLQDYPQATRPTSQ